MVVVQPKAHANCGEPVARPQTGVGTDGDGDGDGVTERRPVAERIGVRGGTGIDREMRATGGLAGRSASKGADAARRSGRGLDWSAIANGAGSGLPGDAAVTFGRPASVRASRKLLRRSRMSWDSLIVALVRTLRSASVVLAMDQTFAISIRMRVPRSSDSWRGLLSGLHCNGPPNSV